MKEISGNIRLDYFLRNQFYKLSKTLSENNGQLLRSQIIGNHLHSLKKEYNLAILVQPIISDGVVSELNYWENFDSYFKFHKVNLREKTSNLSCTELGQYFTIISRAAYDNGRIEHMKPKSPMKRKDIVELLQITDAPCKILINKLIAESLLRVAEGKLKNVISCPRNLVQRNSKNYNPEMIRTVKNFKSMWFISTYVLEHKIFMKNDKSDRKSSGKETLGVFIKLVFLMNELNEVKSRIKQSVNNYIKNYIEVSDIQYHLDILVNVNLIQIENEIIYINPTAVKKSKKTISKKLVDLFNLKSNGLVFNTSLESLPKEKESIK